MLRGHKKILSLLMNPLKPFSLEIRSLKLAIFHNYGDPAVPLHCDASNRLGDG